MSQRPNYRISLLMNQTLVAKHDVYAGSEDEAFSLAYQTFEARNFPITDISVQEIPEGPANIGLKIEYEDTSIKRRFADYIIIRADSEEQAAVYYNQNLKGGRFWFHANKTDDAGKCVRGNILETYFASCPGYDFSAIKEP